MRDRFGIFGTVTRFRELSLLLVMMLRIPNRCMMAAKVGALLPIEEIGPDGKRSIGLPLLLTDGGTLSTYNIIQKVSY